MNSKYNWRKINENLIYIIDNPLLFYLIIITSQSHHIQNDGVLFVKDSFSQKQMRRTQLHEPHFFWQCFSHSVSLLQRPIACLTASEFMIISTCKYVRTML